MRPPIVLAFITVAATASPAIACDIEFATPFDLFDDATTVAIVDVSSAPRPHHPTADVAVVETLKGAAGGASLTITPAGGTCSPGLADGARGVVFLDASRRVIGAYAGFVRDRAMIAALRGYASGASLTDRAAALADLAVSKGWTASFEAAHALAARAELIVALDADRRDKIVKRLRTVGGQHTLIQVAARMQDDRAREVARRRSFDDEDMLTQVLAGAFEAVTSVGPLADAMDKSSTGARFRVAALERCERIWKRSLDRFSRYAYDRASAATWHRRAEACRTGKPVP